MIIQHFFIVEIHAEIITQTIAYQPFVYKHHPY